jgi:Ran GTPase-activating protein (RanGAP) involved in mRNA processing and transport
MTFSVEAMVHHHLDLVVLLRRDGYSSSLFIHKNQNTLVDNLVMLRDILSRCVKILFKITYGT